MESLRIHPMWKGFPLKEWESSIQKLNSNSTDVSTNSVNAQSFPLDLSDFYVLTVDNGALRWSSSVPKGVRAVWLESQQNSNTVKLIGKDAFDAKALAQSKSGLQIQISPQTVLDRPIAVLFQNPSDGIWNSYLHKLEVGAGAEASFFISTLAMQPSTGLHSQRWVGSIQQNSKLNVLFSEPMSQQTLSHTLFDFSVAGDGNLNFVELASNIHLGRSEVHADLQGPNAEASVSGIHLLKGNQTYDSRVIIKHSSAHTTSRQTFKCVVSDKAKSVFGGKIDIVKDAQKVDAAQSHKAILLSESAKAVAYPELEVLADDVKAAHGSSIGQMDKNQIFYLKSRGLSEQESLKLLGEAFVRDVAMKSNSESLRQISQALLNLILPQFIHGIEEKLRMDS